MTTFDLISDVPMGSIGLTQIHGEVGRLIRLGQWLNGDGFADYEHAFVYVGNGRIVEAEPGGARLAPLRYDRIDWIACPEQYGDAVADAACELVGTPYSFADYAALAARRLHIPVPGLREYIADSGHMVCSQLCDEAAQRGGWHLFDDGRWPGYCTPGDLYKLAN